MEERYSLDMLIPMTPLSVFTPQAMAVPLAAESVTKALDECVLESPITGNASKWVLFPLAYIPAVICDKPVPSPIIRIILVGPSWQKLKLVLNTVRNKSK